MNMQTTSSAKSSALPWVIAACTVTFAVGAVGAFIFAQSQQNAQSQAIAALTAQLADMQVSRSQGPDLMAITAPAMAAQPSTPGGIPSASAILAARTPTAPADTRTKEQKAAEAIEILNRNKMRMLTEGVVAGLYSVTSEQTDGAGTRIALNSVNAASTATELEGLLAKAAANGTINVPESIATSDGEVDSQTLLFSLVQQSLEEGSEKEIAAAQEMRRRAFEASAAKTQLVNGQRIYTVESGDSLAYISLQFYGSTNAFDRIFQANRQKIASPDRIQIGQRLVIPEV